ncbi:hypothetical protein CAPN002_22240 [Capnocytophaga stomatis]|uniref:hypothetical protein n=1 Tax=Capnocytophaga stomatis TaxID=1848904 RepID=UPI00194DFAC9|nr:hypothetical protein [Capnocytophaga stomatis]GIJ95006.1 hypothetical protein CAPN002_22240 [Capnocytophaga stomatis]
MKNKFYRFVLLAFPVLVTLFFVFQVTKIDTNLKPVSENIANKKVIIDKHASKRRVYFFVEKHNQQITFERKYSGLATNWIKLAEYRKYENNEIQYFFIEKNTQFDTKENIPFFGLNQSEKNLGYYFDIFLFLREKYFFALLLLFVGFMLGGGYLVDTAAKIGHNKSLRAIFFLNMVYLLFLIAG